MGDSEAGDNGLPEHPAPLRVPVIDVTLRSSVVADEPDARRQLSPGRGARGADGAQEAEAPRKRRVSVAPVRVVSDQPTESDKDGAAVDERDAGAVSASAPAAEEAPEQRGSGSAAALERELAETLAELEAAGASEDRGAVPVTPIPPPEDPDEAAALEHSQPLEVDEADFVSAPAEDEGTASAGSSDAPEVTVELEEADASPPEAPAPRPGVPEVPSGASPKLEQMRAAQRHRRRRRGTDTLEMDPEDLPDGMDTIEDGRPVRPTNSGYEEVVVENLRGTAARRPSVQPPPPPGPASVPPPPAVPAEAGGDAGAPGFAPPKPPPEALRPSGHPPPPTRRPAPGRADRTSGTPPPPPAGSPQPPSQETLTRTARVPEPKPSRPRQHQWWEVFFDDDYLRTVPRPSDEYIARQCDFIQERLGLVSGATLLDVGCGWGSHVVELSARGFLGVGLDLSLAMLSRAADIAQERGQRINFLHADMREMNFDGTFDAVTCLGTTFGYFDDEVNRRVIEKLYNALKPGGVLLLDVVNRDHVIGSQPNLVWFEGEGCVCMEESEFNYFTSRLHVKRTVILDDGKQGETEYSLRLYALHELGLMLHQQGFRVTEVSGREAVPGVFFGTESPRMLIVAERRHGGRHGDATGKHVVPPRG